LTWKKHTGTPLTVKSWFSASTDCDPPI